MGTEKVYCLWLKSGKKLLDRKGNGGTVIMALSKAFVTINYDHLPAKLNPHGFTDESLMLIKSYSTNRLKRTKVKYKL